MPFIAPNTPEALLPRSDSRNPATTCKGITSNGRPCRRSIASPQTSPASSPNSKRGGQGVLAILPDANDDHEDAAVFYCWQHKDQAPKPSGKHGKVKTTLYPLQERTSVDTLAEKLGVMDVDDKSKKKRHGQTNGQSSNQAVRRDNLPAQWQNVPGPFIAISQPTGEVPPPPPPPPRRQKKDGDFHFSFFCCMRSSDVGESPALRPRPAVAQTRPPAQPLSSRPPAGVYGQPQAHPVAASQRPYSGHQISQTQTLMSYIPPSLPPEKTSTLLAELAKPLSASDQEPGYIYIFCLASLTSSRSQMSPAPRPQYNNLGVQQRAITGRRVSEAVVTFAQEAENGSLNSPRGFNQRSNGAPRARKKLMLKIGRAQNVSRRMTQWSQQCGHDIDLLRYYPYHDPNSSRSAPSSPQNSPGRSSKAGPQGRRSSAPSSRPSMPSGGPNQVPLVARVERMIHLELSEMRVKRDCEGCGKEHREWFEVAATKDAVRNVDEVVKRWVRWGEAHGVTRAQ